MKKLLSLLTMLIVAISASLASTTPPTGGPHKPGTTGTVKFEGRDYEVFFSNNASTSSLLVGSNTSTTTEPTSTTSWCNIGSSVGTQNNNISTAFTLNEFTSNVKTSDNKAIRLQSTSPSEKNIVMVVEGYDSIAVFDKNNALDVYAEVYDGEKYGTSTKLTLAESLTKNSHSRRAFALDNTKRYRLTIAYGTSGSTNKDFVAFSLCVPAASTDPSISAEDVDIAATTTGGNIAFTVNNPVDGGAISAEDNAEWLTVGTETSSPISFTAEANTGAERSATVTLTYTYNTDKTVTKNVTVTQAAATYAITYNKGANGTGSIAAGEKSYGVDFTLSSEKFTREGYNQTGWATTDGGEKAYDLGGTYTANAAIELFPVWAALATNITVTYANGAGAEGVVPAALTGQTEGTEITLPKNFTMYKEGFTMTGWDANGDGVADYAPGASYTVPAEDVTLTAQYTPNDGITLANRTSATTIKWGPWNTSNVPAIVTSGEGFFVAQATVAGKTIDVKMPFDATGAKIQNQAGDWTQVLPGTKFYVPSANGATISYHYYDNNVNPAVVDVTSINVDSDTDPYTLTIEAEGGNYYIEYVQVVLPKITITPEAGEIFKLNMTYSGSDKNVTHGTETALGSYGTATSGCEVVIGNKHASDNSKAKITSSGVYFNGNDAYIKVDFNFNLKTGDVITFTSSNDGQICFTTTNTRSNSEKTVSKSYTVGSELNGKSTIYVWRAEASATYVKTLTISRPITLNASGYATFSKSTDFEFSGAKAYKMNLNYTGGTLQGTEVTGKIKAGEGILFKGDAGAKVSIIETTGAETLENNSLVGTTPATGDDAPTPDYTNYKYFVLKGKSFVPYTTATTFGAGKAFFQVDKNAQAPASFELVFDGEATAVEAIAEAKANTAAPVKVIKNGKLYIGNYNVAGARIK